MADDLRIRIGADVSALTAAMSQIGSRLQSQVQGIAAAARSQFRGMFEQPRNELGQFEAQSRLSLGNIGTQLRQFAVAYGALRGIGAMISIADEAALAQARIQGMTGSINETRAAQGALFELAQRLQAPYGEAVASFSRMLPAVKELGGGVQQTTALTEILLTTAKLSGASAAEAASAAIQFAQALGSGKLQGDELRSILENNNTLARTLATGLGVGIGELRRLGEEGKLTSDLVANTLLKAYDDVKARAADLPVTVGGAWTQVKNAFTVLVTTVGDGTGVFSAIAQVFSELGRVVLSVAGMFKTTQTESEKLAQQQGIRNFAESAGQAFAQLYDIVSAVVVGIWDIVSSVMDLVAQAGRNLGGFAAAAAAAMRGDFAGAAEIMRDVWTGTGTAVRGVGEAIGTSVARTVEALKGGGAAVKAYNDALVNAGNAAAPTGPGAPLRGNATSDPEEEKKATAARMAAYEQQLEQAKISYGLLQQEQGTYQAWSKAEEVAFWEERLAAADLSVSDRIAIEKKLTAAQVSEIEAQNAAARTAEKQRIESERRQGQILADMATMRSLAAVDRAQQEAQALLDRKQISDAQYLAMEQDFEAQRFAIQEQAMLAARELMALEGRDPAEVERVNAQLLQLELDYQARKRQIQIDQQGASPLAGLLPDTETLQGALATMFDMTQTWGQKMQNIFQQISATFTRELIIKPISDMMMRYIRESAIYKMLFVQQTTGQAAASATVTATKAAESTAVVAGNAAQAASGAAAAVAPTPFVGPAMAVAAFAAIMAMVMGARSNIKSAAGGYDIPAGINPVTQLHAQEMVLPAEHAETIRELGRAGGSASSAPVELKGVSAGEFFIAARSDLIRVLKQGRRDFAF